MEEEQIKRIAFFLYCAGLISGIITFFVLSKTKDEDKTKNFILGWVFVVIFMISLVFYNMPEDV